MIKHYEVKGKIVEADMSSKKIENNDTALLDPGEIQQNLVTVNELTPQKMFALVSDLEQFENVKPYYVQTERLRKAFIIEE